MAKPSIALTTLCSVRDIERCELLSETAKRFVTPGTPHYIIVDKKDYNLFLPLEGEDTKILRVEDILPWWIRRVPRAKRWWLSFKTKPIRNWILQQLVKLSVPGKLDHDIFVFVDSDVTFVRSFDPHSLLRDGKAPLLRRPGHNPDTQCDWHRTAGNLLDLPAKDYYGSSHIGNLIYWWRDNVLKLHDHIESVSGRGWLETVASQWHLSEYILYGVFVEHVLENQGNHYFEENQICLNFWDHVDLTEDDVREFLGKVEDHHVAVMLTSKAGFPTKRFAEILRETPESSPS